MAGPLVQLARLIEDLEEARNAVGQVGAVLNRPMEANPASGGLRPKFDRRDQLRRRDLYLSEHQDAGAGPRDLLDPCGNHAGVVGRSGSGKSTMTRLLQGITATTRAS